MRIIEQTPTRLKLRHYPVTNWFTGSLLSTIAVGGLIYFIGFAAVSASLSCRRTVIGIDCELQQFTTLGRRHTRKLYDLTGARVEQRSSGKGGRTYIIRLINEYSETSLLRESDEGYSAQQAIVNQINQFVDNPGQSSLRVQQSGRIKASLLGLCAIGGLIGGMILLHTPIVTCAFYKRLDKVVLTYTRWYGSPQSIEHPLSQIAAIEMEEKRVKGGKMYRTILLLRTSDKLVVHPDYTPKKPLQTIVDQIREFLR